MSMIKSCTTTTKTTSSTRRSSCFLGCFGFSGEKMQLSDELKSPSRRRWIAKWRFSSKKSTGKTVPVDLTTVRRKSKSFLDAPATGDTIWEIQVVEEDPSLTKKPVILDDDDDRKIMIGENTNKQSSHRKKSSDSGEIQSRSFRIHRKERNSTETGTLNPPVKKSVTISNDVVSSSLKPLTDHYISQPPAKRKKPPPAGAGGVDDAALNKPPAPAGGFDSLIGMSIILVTLVIMMLWGKLCAILCTSTWFFIAPRLRTAIEDSGVATAGQRRPELQNDVDLESVEYKKKVVLEGFLQRNHRSVVGRL